MQLAATVAIGGLIVGFPAVKAAVLSGPLLLAAFVLSFGPLLYMGEYQYLQAAHWKNRIQNPLLPCAHAAISEKARHQFPKNIILMAVFTIGEGILVGAATSR